MSQDATNMAAVCRWMRLAARVLAIGIFGLSLGLWMTPGGASLMVEWNAQLVPQQVKLDGFSRFLGALVTGAHAAFIAAALWIASNLFGRFATGAIFEPQTGAALRWIGGLTVAYGLMAPLARTLCALAVTWNNPPGQRMLVVSLGIDEFIIGVLGALILVLGHVMAEAAALAEDNRHIV
jgi:hypothetical protein